MNEQPRPPADERDDVSATYNFATYLSATRKMMQAWADYLEVLRQDRPAPALAARSIKL